MKKKGLIISTVVMVVVLIASLTTATYAWFTASQKTEIGTFSLSVTSDNAVDIGIKENYTIDTSGSVSPSAFKTGDVAFTKFTSESGKGAGSPSNPGKWTGADGLSSTLNHNINWGSQSKAVGVSSATNVTNEDTSAVNDTNTGYWTNWTQNNQNGGYNVTNKNTVIAANKGTGESGLSLIKLAEANVGASEGTAGDYVHFILGVSPTRELARNNFVIMVSPTTSSTIGILASVHVAYRVTKYGAKTAGAWQEVDIYGSNNGNTSVNSNALTVSEDVASAYKTAYNADSVPTGSMACVISDLDKQKNHISQVEVVIYLAGDDPDCNDQGKTSAGDIKMFFDTANATSDAPSNPKIDETGKLTLTGVEGSTIEYQINNGEWKKFTNGSWSGTTFTVAKVDDAFKGANVKVRQLQSGKDASAGVDVANSYQA